MALRHAGGLIQASALRVGEKIVATHWGMDGGRFLLPVPRLPKGRVGAKYSVGRLLMETLIEWCTLNQVGVFDLTVGSEPYKLEWADDSMTIHDVTSPLTMSGRLWWLRTGAPPWGRYYLRRLIRRSRLNCLAAMLSGALPSMLLRRLAVTSGLRPSAMGRHHLRTGAIPTSPQGDGASSTQGTRQDRGQTI